MFWSKNKKNTPAYPSFAIKGVYMSRICFPDEVLMDGVSNEAREDFEREVEIMSAFDHDNFLLKLMIILLILGEKQILAKILLLNY